VRQRPARTWQQPEAQPDEALLVLWVDPREAYTVGTDLKGHASRDGGTTWAEASLAREGAHVIIMDRPAEDEPAATLVDKINGTLVLCDITQEDVLFDGHAIEARIYAEDPVSFLPHPGTISKLRFPIIRKVKTRFEHALEEGMNVSPYYDPMLAKVVAWGSTRERAIKRLNKRLADFKVEGTKTSIPLARMARPRPHQPYPQTTKLVPHSNLFVALVMPSRSLPN